MSITNVPFAPGARSQGGRGPRDLTLRPIGLASRLECSENWNMRSIFKHLSHNLCIELAEFNRSAQPVAGSEAMAQVDQMYSDSLIYLK